jgi:hypothetical protein
VSDIAARDHPAIVTCVRRTLSHRALVGHGRGLVSVSELDFGGSCVQRDQQRESQSTERRSPRRSPTNARMANGGLSAPTPGQISIGESSYNIG